MNRSLLTIRAGKMYYLNGAGEFELPSETLRHYIRTTRDRARSKEWKNTGSGAVFLGEERGQDAETVVSQIRSEIHAAVYDRGTVYYSMTVDESSGIYKKDPADLSHEGIVLSDQYSRFEEFSLMPGGDKLLYTASDAGEKHIGILDLATGESDLLTEGNTRDSSPICDPVQQNRILFSSCGLAEYAPPPSADEKEEKPTVSAAVCGPAAICAYDLSSRQITQLLGDDGHDYLHPAIDREGRLWCIRRPYKAEKSPLSAGCLIDILLFLPRLLWSLVQFLSVFSTMFSGKSLTGSTDVKGVKKSQTDLFIDGNRIQAEEELKRNARAGEKHPGLIPRSWELIRLDGDKPAVIAKGICAFLLDGEDIYLSNGASILRMRGEQTEEVRKARGVTCIQPVDK